jgi:hypothetical protein
VCTPERSDPLEPLGAEAVDACFGAARNVERLLVAGRTDKTVACRRSLGVAACRFQRLRAVRQLLVQDAGPQPHPVQRHAHNPAAATATIISTREAQWPVVAALDVEADLLSPQETWDHDEAVSTHPPYRHRRPQPQVPAPGVSTPLFHDKNT